QVPLFQYHLGIAYYQKGAMSSAKLYLEKSVEARGKFPDLEHARAVLKKIPKGSP
ncbi:MAG: hypothetical protein JRJ14_07405, partial [Deltaproteobacteria bacterium]|nr:hypothetical protein [Deltaproteobacteria bacterium]